jgi:fimbrial chaperone protein
MKNWMLRLVTTMWTGAVLICAAPAHGASFSVAPVDVTMSAHRRSQLITIHNDDREKIRFQLSAFQWQERADGKTVLSPTDDVIFFPQLFELDPNESQKIRIGVTVPAGEVERTYRLRIAQLKPPQTQHQNTGSTIFVLTNISIPVFVEPAAPTPVGAIQSLALEHGVLTFTVRNSGNAHLRIGTLKVDGFAGGAQPLFTRQAAGWYVLAQGSRNYEVKLPTPECQRISRLSVSILTPRGRLTGELPTSAAGCARSD